MTLAWAKVYVALPPCLGSENFPRYLGRFSFIVFFYFNLITLFQLRKKKRSLYAKVCALVYDLPSLATVQRSSELKAGRAPHCARDVGLAQWRVRTDTLR